VSANTVVKRCVRGFPGQRRVPNTGNRHSFCDRGSSRHQDTAFQNAKQHSDKQNARIEHDKALARVIVGLMQDDTELFKQFSDNEGFRRWLTDTVFGLTYSDGAA
jgi:hypothetical protein